MAAPTAPHPSLDWVGDRIKDFRRVPPARIKPHPRHWRRHGPDQQRAMQGLWQRLGYVNALLVRAIASAHTRWSSRAQLQRGDPVSGSFAQTLESVHYAEPKMAHSTTNHSHRFEFLGSRGVMLV
jgi:hypothetical protein